MSLQVQKQKKQTLEDHGSHVERAIRVQTLRISRIRLNMYPADLTDLVDEQLRIFRTLTIYKGCSLLSD